MTMTQFLNLDQVAEIKRGTVITEKTSGVGTVPVIAGGLGPAYSTDTHNRPARTITISGSGANAGFVNIWDTEIWASDCSTVNTLDPETVSQQYLYYLLKSKQTFIMSELRQGSAQPMFTLKI